jgi:hypothetical protein
MSEERARGEARTRAAPHCPYAAHAAAWPLLCVRTLTVTECACGPACELGRGEQVWMHVALGAKMIADAAWCYPQPLAGRENIKSCVTFATGKGVGVRLL